MSRSLRATSVAVLFAAASALGCSDRATTTSLEGPPVQVQMFNPQPEPPGHVSSFSDLVFDLDLEARSQPAGDLDDGSAVGIIIVGGRPVGQTIHVEMIWEILPPDPIEPITVNLTGIINTANGRLELNGETEDGVGAHVAGTAEFTIVTDTRISGELMFNPQPEPPGIP